jgi:nicotinamidase-related amidase
MVIDAQHVYVGEDRPLLEQQDQWPAGCGAEAWAGIRNIKKLIEHARPRRVPIIYTRLTQKKTLAFDGFAKKTERKGAARAAFLEGHKGTKIVDELSPLEGDLVVDKNYASAFCGTPLVSYLNGLRRDTILMTGGSTSGCVRATAVDAISRNYNVAVIEDCVFDRIEISHKVNLFDLWMKYCDVITSEEAIRYLETVGE